MLAVPVAGGGLSRAMAIFDFGIDAEGDIADVPSARQSLTLVDGTIVGGAFGLRWTAVVRITDSRSAPTSSAGMTSASTQKPRSSSERSASRVHADADGAAGTGVASDLATPPTASALAACKEPASRSSAGCPSNASAALTRSS